MREISLPSLEQVTALIKTRRATRCFTDTPVSEDLINTLLDAAHWAPSGYNLQPTYYAIITNPETRLRLQHACMEQRQILEAPALLLLLGNRNTHKDHSEKVITADLEIQSITESFAQIMRKNILLGFSSGPCGLYSFLWRIATPLLRCFKPIPQLPAADMDRWLDKQAMLVAMNFMLAAEAAGLSTSPMEGFDPIAVAKVLELPSKFHLSMVIPFGYAQEGKESKNLKKSRLPLEMLRLYPK